MGATAGKLIKRRNTRKNKQSPNQENQGSTPAEATGGIAALAGAAVEFVDSNVTNEVVNEVGKSLADNSTAIAAKVTETVATSLNLSDDKKAMAQKGIGSALKNVGDQLKEKAKESKDVTATSAVSDDKPAKEDKKEDAPACVKSSGSILSHVARNLTERSEVIAETVSTTISTKMNLSADQTASVKQGATSAIKAAEKVLTGNVEAKQDVIPDVKAPAEATKVSEPEVCKKKSESHLESNPMSSFLGASPIGGLLGQSGDVASMVAEKLTQNKTVIADTVVTQVSKVLPQLNLTKEKKITATKTVETVIEKVGETLRDQKDIKAETTKEESKDDKKNEEFLDSTTITDEVEKVEDDDSSKNTDAIASEPSDANMDNKNESKGAEDASKGTAGGKSANKKKRRKNKSNNTAQGANSGSEPTSPQGNKPLLDDDLGGKLDALAGEVGGAKLSIRKEDKSNDVQANGEENGHTTEQSALDESVPNLSLEVTSS